MNNVNRLKALFKKYSVQNIGFSRIEYFRFNDENEELLLERSVDNGHLMHIKYSDIENGEFKKSFFLVKDKRITFFQLEVVDLSK